mmetsp:Transcript_8054/g.21780  ORF Transcript_8054/g.21780 Transcript_8054/m.21780 type:complete len:172 (-) Transcript_8054:536-1051(-)|eukprot:CAMPEP_0198114848 /NCGR_PEP_ID=MMETSP1442-20131203/6103_1 /TAXON_ID= /ORGANISM="Craspedostauros australis, Strain CCMP3328" /LENGTH=171 /DNA_ID=CAMNT_0043772247 /DNA_START=154 /DNA_END=669 /DNA_ORIENTATION=+
MSHIQKLGRHVLLQQQRRCRDMLQSGGRAPIRRRFASSPPTASPPTLQNIGLAAFLATFVGSVFVYSMNAVGRGDQNAADGIEADPLAQLKAEAQEARVANEHKRRLSPEEIEALESGVTYSKDAQVEVAVAAPAEIAQREEEASMKVLQRKQAEAGDETQKKKPWWRFGF